MQLAIKLSECSVTALAQNSQVLSVLSDIHVPCSCMLELRPKAHAAYIVKKKKQLVHTTTFVPKSPASAKPGFSKSLLALGSSLMSTTAMCQMSLSSKCYRLHTMHLTMECMRL
jgi:hypothetical protein